MADPVRPSRPLSSGDALPPVEPPSAGFILQLFIVPGIIVLIIVMVWLLFNWVARTDNDPEEYIRALRRNNAGRWQAAFNLAHLLGSQSEAGIKLRRDTTVAAELASILEEELKKGSIKDEELSLRVYTCQALGNFEVPTGLPLLLRAATTQRSDEEIEVRLAALRAIAALVQNLRAARNEQALADPQLAETLLEVSRDSDPRIRSAAAFALGVLGGPAAHDRLATLLDDSNPDVRYNAADWLASAGDPACSDVLLEMLDPAEMSVGLETEKREWARIQKRILIVANALRAAERLHAKNPDADVAPLIKAIQQLLDVKGPSPNKASAKSEGAEPDDAKPADEPIPLDKPSRVLAREVLHKLQAKPAAVPAG